MYLRVKYIALMMLMTFGCHKRTQSNVNDLSSPGDLNQPNRYYKLVQNMVQMADCAANQVASPSCKLNKVFSRYNDFASRLRDDVNNKLSAVQAEYEVVELPMRNEQAKAAKAEWTEAEGKLVVQQTTETQLTSARENEEVNEKSLLTQKAEIEKLITNILSKPSTPRLEQLLKVNQDDLNTVTTNLNRSQALIKTHAAALEKHRTEKLKPAEDAVEMKKAKYEQIFAQAVTPDSRLQGLKLQIERWKRRVKSVEDMLALLIQQDIPHRANLQDTDGEYIVSMFPAAMKATQIPSPYGVFDGLKVCDSKITATINNVGKAGFSTGTQFVVQEPSEVLDDRMGTSQVILGVEHHYWTRYTIKWNRPTLSVSRTEMDTVNKTAFEFAGTCPKDAQSTQAIECRQKQGKDEVCYLSDYPLDCKCRCGVPKETGPMEMCFES